MTAPGTHFSGPIFSGPRSGEGGSVGGVAAGNGVCQLAQTALLNQSSTNAVSATFGVPKHSQILGFLIDNLTAWNSATSATLTIGTAAAGTQYVTSVDVKTAAGRLTYTFTAAQLAAMADIGVNQNVVVTITPVGATSAGSTRVTMQYLQTNQWDTN